MSNTMKVSDYIIDFLSSKGIEHAFVVQGGAAAHLISSASHHEKFNFVAMGHEQGGSLAVHGYANDGERVGCAFATTGPGVLNLLTGAAALHYDSLPGIFIGGQVASPRFKAKEFEVRMHGFQEAPATDVFAPVTKYTASVTQKEDVRFELEKAFHIATTGRKGPVFLEVCDDVQRESIEPEELKGYVADDAPMAAASDQVSQVFDLVKQAKRPLFVFGYGIKTADAKAQARELMLATQIPVSPTWGGKDIVESDHPLNAGVFGMHATRHGNFAVQNADLLICIGTRLSQHQTGTPPSLFAPNARKVMVDIDMKEMQKLDKIGIEAELLIQADAKDFISQMQAAASQVSVNCSNWLAQIDSWKEQYPVTETIPEHAEFSNPHKALKQLSAVTPADAIVLSEVGATLSWTYQAFDVKPTQRLITSYNIHTMGYAVPGAVGAAFANPGKTVVSINGDGAILMNIQELGVIAKHQLPVKVVIFDNKGYGVIQQTQEDYFNAEFDASSPAGGLMEPDFEMISKGFGLAVKRASSKEELASAYDWLFSDDKPAVCIVNIDPEARIRPCMAAGKPIDDALPFLPRDEYEKNCL